MATLAHDELIWVACPARVWRAARVLSTGDDVLSVEYEADDEVEEEGAEIPLHGKSAPKLLRRNAVLVGEGAMRYDNLMEVPELHEAAVLHALDARFRRAQIYTFTGPVLLAVNPFRSLPLYGPEQLRSFGRGGATSGAPHVYGIAARALEGIRARYESQTVLISGESGAGKTETTKFVMQFLALASKPGEDRSKRHGGLSPVERQVLGSNPLLEAFGNAQTLRNDNSSRFGKYIELQFAKPAALGDDVPNPRMTGARIHTYLLEKVRVIRQQEGERSFHIFYQAIAAAQSQDSEMELEGFRGFGLDSFKYLNKQESPNEVEDFEATLAAMDAVGLSKTEVTQIFRTLAAILHLGNVTFESAGESSHVAEKGPSSPLALAAQLLGVDAQRFPTALTRRVRQTPEGFITSTLTAPKAANGRDALARHLYHAVFNYIVQRSNTTIGFQPNLSFCGVLDIFGFEFFQWNSLEQLCINYTNELLQQYFNEFIFQNETSLYEAEGIRWDAEDFPDNTTILELLHGKMEGVLPMLEEECFHVGGSSEAWCNKLVRLHERNKHFAYDKLKKGTFIIRHFAGPVTYHCTEFLEKNKDELSPDLVQCLKGSEEPFVRGLFEHLDRVFGVGQSTSDTGRGRVLKAQRYSVSGEFRQQLKELLQQIQSTQPHFIRCIKPNPKNQAFRDREATKPFFDRPSVAEQLSYQGVLAAIKVARAGFPVRFWHSEFLREFRCLAPLELQKDLEALVKALTLQEDEAEALRGVKRLLQSERVQAALRTYGWALGKTRVFLKQEPYEALRQHRAALRTAAATRLQSMARGRRQRQAFLLMCRGFLRLQARQRGVLARQQVRSWRRNKAATQLAAHLRTFGAVGRWRRVQRATLRLQSWQRGHTQRAQYQVEVARVLRLQRWWRSTKKRRRFGQLQQSVRKLQAVARGWHGRREATERRVQRFRLRRAVTRLVRLRRRHQREKAFRWKMMEMYRRVPDAPTRKSKDDLIKEVLFLRQLCEERDTEIQDLQERNDTWRQQIEYLRHRIFWRLRDCLRRP